MPEVAAAGEHHRGAGAIGGRDHLVVAHAAARLDRGRGARRAAPPRGRRRTGRRRPRRPRCRPCPAPARPAALAASAALRDRDRDASSRLIWPAPMPTVAPSLANTMAFDLTCLQTAKAKRRSAISAGVGARSVTTLQLELVDARRVALLHQEAAGDRAQQQLVRRRSSRPPVSSRRRFGLAASTARASAVGVRRDHHLGEHLRDLLGDRDVERPIERHDAAIGADRIAGQRPGVGPAEVVVDRDAAGIGVLDDRDRRAARTRRPARTRHRHRRGCCSSAPCPGPASAAATPGALRRSRRTPPAGAGSRRSAGSCARRGASMIRRSGRSSPLCAANQRAIAAS